MITKKKLRKEIKKYKKIKKSQIENRFRELGKLSDGERLVIDWNTDIIIDSVLNNLHEKRIIDPTFDDTLKSYLIKEIKLPTKNISKFSAKELLSKEGVFRDYEICRVAVIVNKKCLKRYKSMDKSLDDYAIDIAISNINKDKQNLICETVISTCEAMTIEDLIDQIILENANENHESGLRSVYESLVSNGDMDLNEEVEIELTPYIIQDCITLYGRSIKNIETKFGYINVQSVCNLEILIKLIATISTGKVLKNDNYINQDNILVLKSKYDNDLDLIPILHPDKKFSIIEAVKYVSEMSFTEITFPEKINLSRNEYDFTSSDIICDVVCVYGKWTIYLYKARPIQIHTDSQTITTDNFDYILLGKINNVMLFNKYSTFEFLNLIITSYLDGIENEQFALKPFKLLEDSIISNYKDLTILELVFIMYMNPKWYDVFYGIGKKYAEEIKRVFELLK